MRGAGLVTQTPLPFADGAAPSFIAGDLTCAACGYNLRGLVTASRCPECGASIAATQSRMLWHADPRWLRRVRLGVALQFAYILSPALIVVILWLTLENDRQRITFAWAIAPLVQLVGVWLIASSEPSGNSISAVTTRRARSLRKCAVYGAAIAVVYWGEEGLRPFDPEFDSQFALRLEWAYLVSWLGWTWLLSRHACELLPRFGFGFCATPTRIVWLLGATGQVCWLAPDLANCFVPEPWLELDIDEFWQAVRAVQVIGEVLLVLASAGAIILLFLFWWALNLSIRRIDATFRRISFDPRRRRIEVAGGCDAEELERIIVWLIMTVRNSRVRARLAALGVSPAARSASGCAGG
jgi:hypothetical protein